MQSRNGVAGLKADVAGSIANDAAARRRRESWDRDLAERIRAAGETDLRHETQDLRMVVVPEISAGTASLAYAAINPVIGLGAFLAQYVLSKPLAEAEFDVADAANCFEFYGGLATKVRGETMQVPANMMSYVLREPVGVCGQIIPWNFPFLMASWKIAPALAAGCTVVLKPSEFVPLSAIKIAELLREAGLPEGILQIVNGGQETVEAICDHVIIINKGVIVADGSMDSLQAKQDLSVMKVKFSRDVNKA